LDWVISGFGSQDEPKKCTSKCHFGGTIEKVWGLARDWNLLI